MVPETDSAEIVNLSRDLNACSSDESPTEQLILLAFDGVNVVAGYRQNIDDLLWLRPTAETQ